MENLSIFDCLYPKYKVDKPIRLIELFAGYGSQALALKYLGVPFEHWKICEWNYKSFEAYKKIHMDDDKDYSAGKTKEELIEYLFKKGISSNWDEPMKLDQIKRLSELKLREIYNNIQATHNLVDISQANGNDFEIEKGYTYILTYSFPCQDLSLAGNRKGMADSNTRSGLLWEVERILKEMEIKPDVLLMENVIQVHNEENMPHFRKWMYELEKMGYQNYWQDLIATDYGIPQIRNRCFMVSLRGEYSYIFPKPYPLKVMLKDFLENCISDKYYLSDKATQNLIISEGIDLDEKTQTDNDRVNYTEIKVGHGYFPGSIKDRPDVISTIDANIGKWHILIGERNGNQ